MTAEASQDPRASARSIARTLVEAGFETYFAGGCVRDRLLGFDATDVDIATSAIPDEVAKLFPRARGVGAHFGVMLVPHRGHLIEVATFRADGAYHDGRRPESVTFGSAEADARRRDFTINGLFEEPESGHVIDHVQGREDLAAGVVRAIGDPEDRFEEDRLRILRAVRFAARFGFEIESRTRTAIVARVDRLAGVSPERVGHELRRMLGHSTWRSATSSMESLGLDRVVLGRPRSTASGGGDEANDRRPEADWIDRLVRWEIDRGHVDPAELDARLTRTLVLSNQERQAMLDLLGIRERIRGRWTGMAVADRKRLAAHPLFGRTLEVLRPDHPELVTAVLADVVTLRESGLAPPPLISGDDLLAIGFTPGPTLGRILHELYDRQLEGDLRTRKDAMRAARTVLKSDS